MLGRGVELDNRQETTIVIGRKVPWIWHYVISKSHGLRGLPPSDAGNALLTKGGTALTLRGICGTLCSCGLVSSVVIAMLKFSRITSVSVLLWLVSTMMVMAHGSFHEKMEKLTAQLRKDPDNAGIEYKMALALIEHEDWDEALTMADQVERHAPGKHPVALIRGLALAGLGRWEQARESLDRYLAIDPGNFTALQARARVLSQLNLHQLAVADYRAALANLQRPPPAYTAELARFQVAAGDLEGALATLDAAGKNHPASATLIPPAVDLEFRLKRPEAALKRMDAWITAAKSYERPAVLAEKARLAQDHHLPEEAARAWEALLQDIAARPPLERGAPALATLAEEARTALGRPANSTAAPPPPAD